MEKKMLISHNPKFLSTVTVKIPNSVSLSAISQRNPWNLGKRLSSPEMSDEPEHRNWLELPRDVTASILSRVGVIDILESVQNVCLLWRDICKDSSMWRSINMLNLGDLSHMPYNLEKVCMHAVDRSNGELVDISIESFGTDELLSYIAQRTKDLRSLRLVRCYAISNKGLSEAASKLPFLEELEMSYSSNILVSASGIAVVGRCCPNLKSFKFNMEGFKHLHWEIDEEARAIAENMHGLRNLQLFGNKLTNSGLLAILDGCPHLESLDLRQCFNVSLQGDLEKRCAQQIKHLRRPNDSTQDYEYDATLRHYVHLMKMGLEYLMKAFVKRNQILLQLLA